jgi:hypothetical protein
MMGRHARNCGPIVDIYELTPWSRVLLEKLIVTHVVEKFSALYGTRGFITVLKTTHHWSLS